MPTNNKDLLTRVNASGFPFQLKIEQEIQDHNQGSVLAREHYWVSPNSEHEGFIDLIIAIGNHNNKLVIECKRVRDAEWVFLVPKDEHKTNITRVLSTMMVHEGRSDATWDKFSHGPYCVDAEFCIIRGQGEKQQPMLERLSAILLRSVEALEYEERDYPVDGQGIRSYCPVIVTTATLQVCQYQSSKIDLISGKLETADFLEVKYIRFTKSMPSSLTSSSSPLRLSDAAEENKRSVFVVNAEYLVEFLKKEWHLVRLG